MGHNQRDFGSLLTPVQALSPSCFSQCYHSDILEETTSGFCDLYPLMRFTERTRGMILKTLSRFDQQ